MICNRCSIDKPDHSFPFRSKQLGTRHSRCNTCAAEASRDWRLNNREKSRASAKKYYHSNRAKCDEDRTKWRLANRKIVNSRSNERDARTRRGYPKCSCCSKAEMQEFYLQAPDGMHVDHIVTKSHGGLHCLKNVQYLTPSEHGGKSNRERWGKDN